MDERTQKQVENRVKWALKEEQSATEKIYDLFAGMEELKENPQWVEIAGHLADCQSHLTNALRRFERV